ncbi:hypothetical protein HK413_04530 [Mucilaginibacter sp. S1162]|uniref:Uncharacterized protein n=1 Tax=Mucilaginibacter humi TaxID=2732510 RepID=A0ABX1W0G1_9SPHI|nr:hypothetical protein [Mucilaginibacter humi]
MKILKSKVDSGDWRLTEFINTNNISREDILTIIVSGNGFNQKYTLFYYEEPKPEDEKKGFWG